MTPQKRKHPILAMFLGFLVNGLGHIYWGRKERGIVWLGFLATMIGVSRYCPRIPADSAQHDSDSAASLIDLGLIIRKDLKEREHGGSGYEQARGKNFGEGR